MSFFSRIIKKRPPIDAVDYQSSDRMWLPECREAIKSFARDGTILYELELHKHPDLENQDIEGCVAEKGISGLPLAEFCLPFLDELEAKYPIDKMKFYLSYSLPSLATKNETNE